MPGAYAEPAGCLLLAIETDRPAGCVGLRSLDGNTAEIKRLYVRREFRGQGIGRSLAMAAIAAASERGYRAIRLDTMPLMAEAIALYRDLGFHRMEPYGLHPPGAICMELVLEENREASNLPS